MRAVIVVVLLVSGCSLYFPSDPPGDAGRPIDAPRPTPDAPWPAPDAAGPAPDAPPPADAPWPSPDAPGESSMMARCEDGRLYAVPAPGVFDEPPAHDTGRPMGRCPGACQSAAVLCLRPDCEEAAATLCGAASSVGATCPLEGASCVNGASLSCPESTACSEPVVGSTCTCTDNTYHCTQATPAATTQARIVGTWRGTVTPPGFAPPYPITLWIYPDGSYWPECALPHCSAFYYGGDGPSPNRKITILSTSNSVGSWADIAIDFDLGFAARGMLSALVVDATTLRFTFSASWWSCGQPFDVALMRD